MRPPPTAIAALALTSALALFAAAGARPAGPGAPRTAPAGADTTRSSAWWLGRLPDGVEKRRFILDCTGCHQFNETRVFWAGAPRTRARWASDVARMLRYAGASSGFPVISAGRDSLATAEWLATHLGRALGRPEAPAAEARPRAAGAAAEIREYDLPAPMDLPHDIAVAADGAVLATGMFTHRIYRIDPESGRIDLVPIPVEKANPRAIEVDRAGRWWVLLGAPKRVARHDPASGRWEDWPIGLYPHSIAVSDDGASVWFNGHFTRDPERIGRLAVATGAVDSFDLPRHPGLAAAGGPLPYELRLGPDGTVWMSELQGNRIVSLDPASGATRAYTLPTAWSGPRRFDVDRSGVLWIPEYAASRLARFDPRTERFEEFALPIRDALPYVARVHPASGEVWIGTAAADAVLRFDPRRRRFDVFPLPTRGATVRHLAIDPVRGDVWMAYGASPAIHPPRVARLRPR